MNDNCPVLVVSVTGPSVQARWEGCDEQALCEDFDHGRMVCPTCGAELRLDDARRMARAARDGIDRALQMFEEEGGLEPAGATVDHA